MLWLKMSEITNFACRALELSGHFLNAPLDAGQIGLHLNPRVQLNTKMKTVKRTQRIAFGEMMMPRRWLRLPAKRLPPSAKIIFNTSLLKRKLQEMISSWEAEKKVHSWQKFTKPQVPFI
jgi:hypothetical protein